MYSRYVNVGLFYLRQLFFANFDIKVHTDKGPFLFLLTFALALTYLILLDSRDYTELWNTMRESISFVKGGEPTPGQGTFNHIAGGYDAGYYS